MCTNSYCGSRLAQADAFDIALRRARERNGRQHACSGKRRVVELQWRKITRMEFRCVGIRDVFGQNPLARLGPSQRACGAWTELECR